VTDIENAVVAIFRSIDRRDWDELEKLLSPDVVYSRPGHPDFTSRADFIHFYKNARRIDTGRHSLRAIITKESLACCWGAFNGMSSDGGAIDILFSDWYEFANGLVRARRTFIFAP
jgi:ketosteroid isomerase-like protein